MSTTSENDLSALAALLQSVADKNCDRRLTGIAIGVIVEGQEVIAVSGWADAESRRPVSTSTVFEVGSLSKLFTSLLLAVAVERREVGLEDPVQDALGEDVKLPGDATTESAGKSPITYRSLANHRSSLPRLPADLIATGDPANPYAHYDQPMLYACLNRMGSVRPIGSREEYSNLAVGLLGHVLGKLAGSDYRQAVKERVFSPLGMTSTTAEACAEQAGELATSYRKPGQPTAHWDFTEVTVAAGGICSSLTDMLKFLRANLNPESTPLAAELRLMREPSELPACERRSRLAVPAWLAACMVVAFASLFAFILMLPTWLARITGVDLWGLAPGGFLPYFAILAATMSAALCWGRVAGGVALVGASLLTWRFWQVDLAWIVMLIFGVAHIWAGLALRTPPVSGAGRLAWQFSSIRKHPLLWHNGMVGGSASLLGMVEDLGLGVVVLTNTARSVDAVGVEVLSELVKRAEQGGASERA